jgi:DNA-directed RNA polymerase specialized sigma24 family protein
MYPQIGHSHLQTRLAQNASTFRREALHYACRCGMRDMEAEDCASAFICFTADLFTQQPTQYERLQHPAYRRRCIQNHTRRWSQSLQRQQAQETDYALQNARVTTNAPLNMTLSHEFFRVLDQIMQSFPADGREAFWQLQAGENVESIARQQGKSANAVRLTLTRLRRRLRAGLARCGWDQSHCEEMLVTILQTVTERNFLIEEKYPT